ncbi:MAG: glycosyltransferase [archaeon]
MNFDRLLRRLDEIAPKLNEKLIVQRGPTKYRPKNYESHEFIPNINEFYKEARVVIAHGGSSVWEFAHKYKKPLIITPRLSKYKEHFNDHQAEFAEFFSKKTGIKAIYDMAELTPELLKDYNKIASIDKENLNKLKGYLSKVIVGIESGSV